MRAWTFSAGVALAAIAGCQGVPSDVSIADYCASPGRAGEDVCKLNVEIDGQRTALAETNLKLQDARELASQAFSKAADAQGTAETALAMAEEASLREADLSCETRVIQQTNVGTCRAGYSLMSCTQTRYTTRAGGLSFLREINDQQCRFNSQVLEMHVRCCRAGEALPDQTASLAPETGY